MRVNYKHGCGYVLSLKLNGVSKTRTCPGCGKNIHVEKLAVFKQVQPSI